MVCDLAEVYHVFDYRSIKLTMLAKLVIGLRAESRTKMRLTGSKLTMEQTLLASIFDLLNLLVWSHTEDAKHKRNRPKSMLEQLTSSDDDHEVFETGEEFDKARAKLIGGNS